MSDCYNGVAAKLRATNPKKFISTALPIGSIVDVRCDVGMSAKNLIASEFFEMMENVYVFSQGVL